VRAAGLYEGEGDAKDLAAYEGAGSLLEKSLAWIKDKGTDNGEYTILLDNEESNKTTDGYVNNTTNGYVIGMFDNSNGNNSSTGNKKSVTITLQSAGEYIVEIKKTGQGALFTVCGYDGSDVPELILENIMLKGNSDNNTALVVLGNGTSGIQKGALTMNAGSQITGNTGGGVSIQKSSTFIMKDGIIDLNTVTANNIGGGVTITGGTFEMRNGSIKSNSAASESSNISCGGVAIMANSTFTMSGGIIQNNTTTSSAKTAFSGGVYVAAATSTFNMSGDAVIRNNTGKNGGGVTLVAGAFNMSGGSIEGNRATAASGAAVFAYTPGNVTISKTGGTIYGINAEGGKANKAADGAAVTVHAIELRNGDSYDETAGPSVTVSSNKSTTLMVSP
jgi:hypothetical protein